ncbi:MAG: TMEM14 family protein [Capsulimonas sp.]|uniref:TMEM14 family protein n=1 Tax=Capsulimonas sp. TaxID=2494211 RepID=UPI003264851B
MMITLYVIYGVLLIVGGIMGYAKAKSQASLIAGIATGALALIGAGVYDKEIHHIATSLSGHALRVGGEYDNLAKIVFAEAFLAMVVATIFISRYAKTKKAMPAIPVIVLSAIVIIASFTPMAMGH